MVITKVSINVTRKKLFPAILKNQTMISPIVVIKIPPTNSHFQATQTINNSTSQGIELELFLRIPFIPPPFSSAPDKSANTNIPIIRRVYLEVFLRMFANFNLFDFIALL